MRKRESIENGTSMPAQAATRGRRKWVSHGLSNRIVFSGLRYGTRWLPLPVLHGLSLFCNSLAVILMRETLTDIRENFRLAFGVPEREAGRLARHLFFEYGRSVIDVWRLRSEAFVPKISSFDADRTALERVRRDGRGFLLVTGHVGNWELGAVTLRGHGLTPSVVGQPELDPDVEAMRLGLRKRLGVESIDIGSSTATAFRVRAAVEAGRAVALLVDRAYPEDQVMVSYFGRPTPFLRSPALLARFCKCEILPGFFLRSPDGSYFNVWGTPVASDESLSPAEDARRIMSRVAADLEGVVRAHPTQWFNFYRFWGGAGASE